MINANEAEIQEPREIHRRIADKKVIVLGKGFLGTRISETLGYELSDFRVSVNNSDSLDDFLEREKPDVIINAIGKTHGKKPGENNIDYCEKHQKETEDANVLVLKRLARACAVRKKYLINLGSGCIYNGDKNGRGFSESDKPNFGLNGEQYYAFTKIQAEQVLKEIIMEYPNARFLQLRLRMPIDDRPSERNLITKLIGYDEVIDVQNSMTIVPHMIEAMKTLIENEKRGIYNLVNPGTISAARIMQLYKELVDPNHKIKVISLKELEDDIVVAKRSNCYLDTTKLRNEGIILPNIHYGVRECLSRYLKH